MIRSSLIILIQLEISTIHLLYNLTQKQKIRLNLLTQDIKRGELRLRFERIYIQLRVIYVLFRVSVIVFKYILIFIHLLN